MTRKVIVTCAVVGENKFNKGHPSFPITPSQIADAAREAELAGASVVHLHVRNPENGDGSRDPMLFLEMAQQVRMREVRSIINITCGGEESYVQICPMSRVLDLALISQVWKKEFGT